MKAYAPTTLHLPPQRVFPSLFHLLPTCSHPCLLIHPTPHPHLPTTHSTLIPPWQVRQIVEGYLGSRYAASVVEVDPAQRRALVRYHEFIDEDSGEKVADWMGVSLLRPLPPPAKPGFLRKCAEGAPLELLHEDGVWDVDLLRVRDPAGREPPAEWPTQFAAQTRRASEDGTQWEVGTAPVAVAINILLL